MSWNHTDYISSQYSCSAAVEWRWRDRPTAKLQMSIIFLHFTLICRHHLGPIDQVAEGIRWQRMVVNGYAVILKAYVDNSYAMSLFMMA